MARKVLLFLLAPLLTFLLYVTAVDIGLTRVASHPETIKRILSDSGIYNSVVGGLLDQAKNVSSGGQNISLQNGTVRAAAEETFTPALIQNSTETVIDSVYRWLDGKTPLPDFQIDLTPVKAQFAANVAQDLQTRLSKLPVCATAVNPNSFDPQTTTCMPRGLTPASEAAAVQSGILNGQGFLDHPVITADSIKSNNSGKSIFADQLKNAPSVYQKVKASPIVLGTLGVLTAVAVIFLSSSRRKGIRRVSMALIGVGIFMLIFAWGTSRLVNGTLLARINLNNSVLTNKVRTLVKDATGEINKNYWQFGGGYTAAGILGLGGASFIRTGGKKARGGGSKGTDRTPNDQPVSTRSGETLLPKNPAPAPQPGVGDSGVRKIKIQ